MANVIKTVITYPLNGSTRDFQIPFEYLARKFVQVTLIGRDRKELINIQDYRFTSKTQITTNQTWGVGDGYELIELRRFTSATDRLVDFADGSILRAYDLNVSQIQTLHVAEEARDLTADTIGVNNEGHLDARGRRIVNVADPVNPLDAVNLKTIKEWNDGAYQSYIKAKAEAEKAAASAAAAKTSETNAYSHMTQAGISERRSKASEVAAAGSQSAAANSATNAANSAGSASSSAQQATAAKDYTKQQADRAYNEAERAKGYADGMGNAIDIGKAIDHIDLNTNDVYWKGNQYSAKNFVARGLNFQIRPSDKTGFAIEMGVNAGSTSAHYAWKRSDSSSWNIMYYPEENNATFATRQWMQQYVRAGSADSETLLRSRSGADGSAQIFVRSNDYNIGMYLDGATRFRVAKTAITTEGGCRTFAINGTDNSASNRPQLILDSRADLWRIEPDGAGKLQIVHPVTGALYEFLKEGGTQQVASRQWVSTNFSKGSKLGPVVTGNYATLGTTRDNTLALDGFKSIMSQVPSNAVFCGVTFGTSGGFTTGAPKWRVITG